MQVVLGRSFLEWRVDEGENRFEPFYHEMDAW